MKKIVILTLAAIALTGLSSCVSVGRPLAYVARERPEGKIQTSSTYSHTMKLDRSGIGRSPADLGNYLWRAESAAESKVLKNFDIILNTPGCFLVVCMGKDKVRINKEGEPTLSEMNNL